MKQPDELNPSLKRINEQLDRDIEQLPADVVLGLQLARQRAVAQALRQTKLARYETRTLWAFAASAVLAVPLLWWMKATHTGIEQGVMTADLRAGVQTSEALDASEIMLQWAQMSEEDLAIVDDLEFIAWLNEQDAEPLDQQRS